ncbi:hypothetical protein LINGRAHAP2_LOCUS9059 [Linum grandiflorum]
MRVTHAFCEGNRVADCLTHHGHFLSFGFHHIPVISREVTDCIRSDSVGVYFPRHVLLIN